MKKNLLFFSCLICLTHFANLPLIAQSGLWTWISGVQTTNFAGVYGTQGVPSVNNFPGGCYEYVHWKDKQGNFWLYGGTYPSRSDLWKFNPATLEWTWVKGSMATNEFPVFGIQGIPDPANTPGERSYAATSWVDTTGNLWMFGGVNNQNYMGDLWMYDISTNQWTWIGGSNVPNASGIHGVQGVPGILNRPGSRSEAVSAWTDEFNNLWVFGGDGYDDSTSFGGSLNDLMKYNIATGEWTWMKGSRVINMLPVYGTKGVEANSNDPGSRWSYCTSKDLQGNFWVFGGRKFTSILEDLWKFNPNTNNWTWISGSGTMNDSGAYINQCSFDTLNFPRARTENRSISTDRCGRLWMFGGTTGSISVLNDLWVFDPAVNTWSWMSGTNLINQMGVYGTIGVPSAANIPPPRVGANAWWGDDDRFYLFGGGSLSASSPRSDLWIYEPDTTCLMPCNLLLQFTAIDSICPGVCIDYNNLTTNASSYQWIFQGASPDSSTAFQPTNICYNTPGTYDVTLIANNINASDTLLLPNYITVYPIPPPQGILQNGDTLFANPGAASYQWFFNGNPIPGATNYFYVAQASGNYNVVATDNNQCEVEAVINNVLAYAQLPVGPDSYREQLAIYPDPVTEKLYVKHFMFSDKAFEISIYNVMGEKIISGLESTGSTTVVDVTILPSGLYYLKLSTSEKTLRTKFIKK